MLINDGDRAARIHSVGARFYAGKHPSTGAEVPLPLWSAVEQCHVLEAGQAALFELRVMKRVDTIIKEADKTNHDDQDLVFSRDQIMFLPGNLDKPRLIITVMTYADPFNYQDDGDIHRPLMMRANGHVQVVVKREPVYPQSFEYLHAELRGDEDRLYSLWYFDELRQSLDRRASQGGVS